MKRAIEAQARVQQKRELRERFEERKRRRALQPHELLQQSTTIDMDYNKLMNDYNDHDDGGAVKANEEHKQKQVNKSTKTKRKAKSTEYRKPQFSNGELVCSATYNGHQHWSNVSWRFLWRCYILYHNETKKLIEDENGRKLLKECGIENAHTLKFYKREKYFGKKRQ